MYELTIQTKFSAAHQLRNYNGRCENLHGHNWKVDVYVTAEKLDDVGLAVDFRVLKDTTNGFLDQIEHKFLNDIPPFNEMNPSSENIARWLYLGLSNKLNDGNVKVSRIRVWESDNAAATYSE